MSGHTAPCQTRVEPKFLSAKTGVCKLFFLILGDSILCSLVYYKGAKQTIDSYYH